MTAEDNRSIAQSPDRSIAQSPNHSITQSLNRSIKTVGVVGAGQMGHGIAHVMLRAGLSVLLTDASAKFLESGAARIAKGRPHDIG